jgi:hypothetical protein
MTRRTGIGIPVTILGFLATLAGINITLGIFLDPGHSPVWAFYVPVIFPFILAFGLWLLRRQEWAEVLILLDLAYIGAAFYNYTVVQGAMIGGLLSFIGYKLEVKRGRRLIPTWRKAVVLGLAFMALYTLMRMLFPAMGHGNYY